jgi:hypothetical protein
MAMAMVEAQTRYLPRIRVTEQYIMSHRKEAAK